MTTPTFEIFKSDVNNQYYFRLKAENGKLILASEGYTAKQSCKDGIQSVKRNAATDERYEKRTNNGSFTFVLKATNGEIIGRSQSYSTPSNRDTGIEAVKKDAPHAPVEEMD
jgi:uncharacterized protein YegP (UPF0339 family)